jgi:hypothetical protein
MTETLLLVVFISVPTVAVTAIFGMVVVAVVTRDRSLVDVLGKAFTGILRHVARPAQPRARNGA